MCSSINESLTQSLNQTSSLNKKLKDMQKERTLSKTRQRSLRQKEMQKTKAVFRSLSDIRNTYEKSQKTMQDDYKQFEQMVQRMRDYREHIGDKRR